MNTNSFAENATVILVRGAWADGSSWSQVILPLQHQGLKVICDHTPLLTAPEVVVDILLEAARETLTR